MILVRPARESDRPALELILSDTFLADHVRYIPEPVDPEFVRAFSHDLVTRSWGEMMIAELGGSPAGMLFAAADRIEALNVLPTLQRRGIGTALMDQLEPKLVARGLLLATLDTQEANLPARRFYQKRGYKVTRIWDQTAFTTTPIRTVTMVKHLAKSARLR